MDRKIGGKAISIWLNACLLVIVLAMLTCQGCASVRVETKIRPSVIVGEFPSPMFPIEDTTRTATTGCDALGNPVIFLNPLWTEKYTAIEWWKPAIIHEYVHANDILNYPGGCKAAQERASKDKDFRLQMELRAYCAAFQFQVKRGDFVNNDLEFRRKFAFVYELLGSHLSISEFWSRVPCATIQPIVVPNGVFLQPRMPP